MRKLLFILVLIPGLTFGQADIAKREIKVDSLRARVTNLWIFGPVVLDNDTILIDGDSISLKNLLLVSKPKILTLTTGSNAILLNNLVGQEYYKYNMTSGALTLTVGAHINTGGASGKITADGSTLPDYSAFTLLDSVNGDYDNTNGVVNWWSAFWDEEDNKAYILFSRVQ